MLEKPITPPSFSADQTSKMGGKLNMKKDFIALFKNTNFLIMGGAFINSFAIQVSMGALLPYLTIPYGFSNAQGGIFGIFFIVCGIVASGPFSGYLDKSG